MANAEKQRLALQGFLEKDPQISRQLADAASFLRAQSLAGAHLLDIERRYRLTYPKTADTLLEFNTGFAQVLEAVADGISQTDTDGDEGHFDHFDIHRGTLVRESVLDTALLLGGNARPTIDALPQSCSGLVFLREDGTRRGIGIEGSLTLTMPLEPVVLVPQLRGRKVTTKLEAEGKTIGQLPDVLQDLINLSAQDIP